MTDYLALALIGRDRLAEGGRARFELRVQRMLV
ncbi:MAG: hypothetical protein JWN96_2403, partial [Mycobacterium sp.]|nr:hypothetical protein [Mycobacterium sp.]